MVDPREDRGSMVRVKFKDILVRRMYGQNGAPATISPMSSPAVNGMFNTGDAPPSLPPIASVSGQPAQPQQQTSSQAPQLQQKIDSSPTFQLPPLSFDSQVQPPPVASPPLSGKGRTSLTPITERSRELSDGHAGSVQDSAVSPPIAGGSGGASGVRNVTSSPIQEEGLSGPLMESPNGGAKPFDETHRMQTVSPPMVSQVSRKFSQDSSASSGARLVSPTRMVSSPSLEDSRRVGSPSSDPANVRLPTSSMQSPTSEQAPSISSQMRFSPKPATTPPPNPSITMVTQQRTSPKSPHSERSRTSVLSSPFSQEGMGPMRLSLDQDQPPVPPSKSPLRSTIPMDSQQNVASTSASAWQQPTTRSPPPNQQQPNQPEYVFDEDGALYYVNESRQDYSHTDTLPIRPSQSGTADSDESGDEHSMLTNPMSVADTLQSPTQARPLPSSPPTASYAGEGSARRQTPMGFEPNPGTGRSGSPGADSENAVGEAAGHLAPRTVLGRKPSGARALPPAGNKRFESSTSLSATATPEEQPQQSSYQPQQLPQRFNAQMTAQYGDDDTVDALAALSFLEQNDSGASPSRGQSPPRRDTQTSEHPLPPPPQIMEPEDRAPSPQAMQYKSSFAPSKQAAERKARSQAQQAAHEAVLHKPGRPNGKQKTKPKEGGWESSEEEEEEEDDEDEDGDSDDDKARGASASRSSHGPPTIVAPVGRNPAVQQQMRGLSPSNSGMDPRDPYGQQQQYQRAPRTLPQIPRGRSPGGEIFTNSLSVST